MLLPALVLLEPGGKPDDGNCNHCESHPRRQLAMAEGLGRSYQERGANHGHEDCGNERDDVGLAVAGQIDGNHP